MKSAYPIMRPGMCLTKAARVAKKPACGPPYPSGTPNRWLVPSAMSQPSSPGGRSSVSASRSCPVQCNAEQHSAGQYRGSDGERAVLPRHPDQLGEVLHRALRVRVLEDDPADVAPGEVNRLYRTDLGINK